MSYKNNLIREYIDATKNEIAIENWFARIFNVDFNKTGRIPRVSSWMTFSKKESFLRFFYFFLMFSWCLGGGALFFLAKLLRGFYKSLFSKRKFLGASGIALLFSDRAELVIRQAIDPSLIAQWVVFDGVHGKNKKNEYISIHQLISIRYLLKAFFLSLRVSIILMIRKDTRRWALQGYTAFDWIVCRLALSEISGSIYIAEHFDRWASLTDMLCSKSSHKLHLSIVQHGSLKGLNGLEVEALNLYYRLENVRSLYCYGNSDLDFFKMYVLDSSVSNLVECNFYSPKIELVEDSEKKTGEFKVFFIGHGACEQFHISLLHELEEYGIKVIYKAHPRNMASVGVKRARWAIWDKKDVFPIVDVVVSYPSTLLIEYSNMNVPVITHPINPASADFDLVLAGIFCEYKKHSFKIKLMSER